MATGATELLEAHTTGDPRAADALLPLVYDELRALARRYLKGERPGSTLQPTALVHEAWLRLIEMDQTDWKSRSHFFAMAATQMRRVLVDRSRSASAQKRGGRPARVTLTEDIALTPAVTLEFLALDEALNRLQTRSARQCRVAELRLFSGLTIQETAFVLEVSERTVDQDWRVARAWLMKELGAGQPKA